MSKRRHSRPAARRRAPARRLSTGNSVYRRALRYEPLEDRRLLAVVTVDTLSDSIDFNDGHTSLREAIFATNTVPGADTINFAPSLTAGGPATILLTQGELKITDALTINGPEASALTINATYGNSSTTGPVPNLFNVDDGTNNFIDVSIGGLSLTANTSATFGALINSAENLTLTDSTLTGNHVAGFGVTSRLGNLTVSGSTVSGNRATGISMQGPGSISYSTISGNGQGGVYTRGALTVDHTTITGNTNQRAGGGIYSNPLPTSPQSLTITDSTIDHNTTSFSEGGGVRKRYGNLTIERSIVSNNVAFSAGGGMSIADDTFSVLISDSVISGNVAGAPPFQTQPQSGLGTGGGIFVTNGTITVMIEGTQVSGNRAGGGPGGIATGLSIPVTIDSSTINNNSGAQVGGIYVGGNLLLTNSTVSGNVSSFSTPVGGVGGISVGTHATIQFSTITNNSVVTPRPAAGGILASSRGPVILCEIYSSIVAGNGISDVGGGANYKSDGYNVIGTGGGAAAFNQPGDQVGVTNPLLGPLADNGGTLLPDGSHILTHALLSGSPAINAGDLGAVAGVNGVPLYDEREMPFGRVYSGRIDIGAFEYQSPSDLNLVVDTLVDESDGNYGHGDLSLREAILLADMYSGPNYPGIVQTIHFDPALTANGPATILLTMGELKITGSMEIDGPGANLLTIDASGNDPTPTKQDGKGSRIFNIDDGTSNSIDVTVAGLKLTGGDTSGFGGAILSQEDLSIADSTISGNRSTSGGGIYTRGELTIERTNISSNTSAGRSGGGIYSNPLSTSPKSLTITDSTIANNTTTLGEGGGVRKRYGDLTIERSNISNNTAFSAGGGMSIADGTFSVLIADCAINGNTAGLQSGLGGGGVFVTNVEITVSVERSMINSNHAANGGGLVVGFFSQVTIDSSTISNNSGGLGPAISVGGNLLVTNSTISGNVTNRPAGVGAIAVGMHATIEFSTITNNMVLGTAPGTGGISSAARGSIVLCDILSSIVAGNSGSDLGGVASSYKSDGYNIVGTGTGTAAFDQPGDRVGVTNPMIGPLADNGGFLLPDGSHILTHALLAGSPAINAGDLNAVAGVNGVPQYDERGTPFGRVSGGRIDIGAFESQPNPLPGDFNYDGTVDSGDYLVWRIAETKYDPRADANGDGRVDDSDLAVWRANFGQAYAASAALVAAVTPQSVRFAAPQMMADYAVIEGTSGSTESAFMDFVPTLDVSVGESKTPLARGAVGGGISRDSLALLAQDAGATERPAVERAFGRRHNNGDAWPDESGADDAVVDEVFAELGDRSSLVRSV